MIFSKSEFPGSAERHLLRRCDNPLFETDKVQLEDEALVLVQKADHDEILAFQQGFKEALSTMDSLKINEDSEVILKLKEQLEQLYEQSCRVGDEQTENQQALVKLIAAIMTAIRQGAGNDAQALQELEQEELARTHHFQLLQSPLVADLLDPNSVIAPQHLVPTLLSSEKDELTLVLQIFDEAQLLWLIKEADDLIERLAQQGLAIQTAVENFAFIQGYLHYLHETRRQQANS
ncbi:MAG: hypothetical protein ACWA5U_08825 [bacterium]